MGAEGTLAVAYQVILSAEAKRRLDQVAAARGASKMRLAGDLLTEAIDVLYADTYGDKRMAELGPSPSAWEGGSPWREKYRKRRAKLAAQAAAAVDQILPTMESERDSLTRG